MSTNQPSGTLTNPIVSIYNTDTKTIVSPVTSTIYKSELPVHWNLNYDFGLPSGHTCQSSFIVDSSPLTACWSPPYLPNSRAPFNLSTGKHTIQNIVNGTTNTPITFDLEQSPPLPPPPPTITTVWGANYAGANWPQNDPMLHPELASTQTALNQRWVRLWIENDSLKANGDSYWNICRNWRKLGFKVAVVNQIFQYQNPRGSMASDANLIAFTNQIVASKAVDAVIWGNECSSPGYFTGTTTQLIHMLSIVTPITKAAGILNVAPSSVDDTQWVINFIAQGAGQYVQALDFHSYMGTGTQVVSKIITVNNYAKIKGLQTWISEMGTRPGKVTPVQWATQQAIMLQGLRELGIVAFFYPQIPLEGASGPDNAFPLTNNYQKNQPFYDMYVENMN